MFVGHTECRCESAEMKLIGLRQCHRENVAASGFPRLLISIAAV
jgi:hypothetical protein